MSKTRLLEQEVEKLQKNNNHIINKGPKFFYHLYKDLAGGNIIVSSDKKMPLISHNVLYQKWF